MLLLRSFRRHRDRSMVHPAKGSHLRSLSLRARVFHPNTRIDVRLLGPCFKTGRLEPLRQRPRIDPRTSAPPSRMTPRVITLPEEPLPQGLSPAGRADAGPTAVECTGPEPRCSTAAK